MAQGNGREWLWHTKIRSFLELKISKATGIAIKAIWSLRAQVSPTPYLTRPEDAFANCQFRQMI
jgi:hypothetical protein